VEEVGRSVGLLRAACDVGRVPPPGGRNQTNVGSRRVRAPGLHGVSSPLLRSKLFAELEGGHSGYFAEAAGEVALVVEAGGDGDAADGFVGGTQQALSFLDAEREDVLHRRETKQSTKPKAEKILLGIDAHLTKYVVARQFDGATPQPAQRFEEEALLKWVQKQLRLGHNEWTSLGNPATG